MSFFCPSWGFPDVSGSFLILSRILLEPPTRNIPEGVRHTIGTFLAKGGQPPWSGNISVYLLSRVRFRRVRFRAKDRDSDRNSLSLSLMEPRPKGQTHRVPRRTQRVWRRTQ